MASEPTTFVIGDSEDEHVQAVLAACGSVAPIVLDAGSLERSEFCLDGDRLLISSTGDRWVDLRGSRGWVRRLSPPRWRQGVVTGSREAAERGSWISLVIALGSHPGVAWLTPYPRLVAAENKPRQYAHAARIDIRTPRTVVASGPELIPSDLGDAFVVKPLGIGHYLQPDGEARVLWAQSLDRDDPRLHAMGGAPFLIQEQLEAVKHLRVVTVGKQAWSGSLEAHGLPLDWRRDDDAHHTFQSASEPAVEESAIRLAHDLGLGYSSQDWIVTDNGNVFIDLNPAGQWLFLPESISAEVTAAVAGHLAGD